MFSRTTPEAHAPVPGSLIGRWRLLERVGSGNNGITYRACLAEEPGAGEYALKLARWPYDARFEREAELLSRVSHPHVPGLRDWGTWQVGEVEYPYLVMQWVEGMPLYDWAKLRGLTSRQALLFLAQVARALEATHQHGVHRDVKGDNILVTSDGKAVLLDYGCCWYEGARPLTDSAVPPGTPPYRSPRCLRFQYKFSQDREAHYEYLPEDDVYALGVTAYYLVTGTYPPPPTDPECDEDPRRARPPRRLLPSELATVTPELEALILRMLSEDGQARGSAGKLAEALEKAAQSAGPEADHRVRPTRSALPTEHASRPGPSRCYLVRKALQRNVRPLGVLAMFAAIFAVMLLPTSPVQYQEPSHLVEAPELLDAGTEEQSVGLGDGGVEEVLASALVTPRKAMPTTFLALPMPKKPAPGQRRPPCDSDHRAINGLCWWVVTTRTPPCGDAYEHDDKCYAPVIPQARPPTSEEP